MLQASVETNLASISYLSACRYCIVHFANHQLYPSLQCYPVEADYDMYGPLKWAVSCTCAAVIRKSMLVQGDNVGNLSFVVNGGGFTGSSTRSGNAGYNSGTTGYGAAGAAGGAAGAGMSSRNRGVNAGEDE